MYYTDGPANCVKNMYLAAGSPMPAAINVIRNRYLAFCRSIGGNTVAPAEIRSLWENDEQRILQLTRHFLASSSLTDISVELVTTDASARRAAEPAVFGGLDFIREKDTLLRELFELAIHTLFYQRSTEAGGGSISSAPGVIWCAIRRDWTPADCAEFLIHELTHNLLFIDERVNRHYQSLSRISDPSSFARSAVLRIQRPLDKVFHSLVVAAEVLEFRKLHGEPENPKAHPPTHSLVRNAIDTIFSIEALPLPELVEKRFMEIFYKIRYRLVGESNYLRAA